MKLNGKFYLLIIIIVYLFPETYTAVTVIKNHNCEEEEEDEDKPNEYFLFFGGSYNATAQNTVITFSEEKYKQIKLIILYL